MESFPIEISVQTTNDENRFQFEVFQNLTNFYLNKNDLARERFFAKTLEFRMKKDFVEKFFFLDHEKFETKFESNVDVQIDLTEKNFLFLEVNAERFAARRAKFESKDDRTVEEKILEEKKIFLFPKFGFFRNFF